MSFQELLQTAQEYFPNLQVRYKSNSWLMRFLGRIFFFSPSFMTDYATTFGETIYFPDEKFVKKHPVSVPVMFLHELVHLYDQKRISRPLFVASYLFPQILVPPCLLLMFFITWKIMLPLTCFFLLPLPAVFRMYWEKRAYLASLYIIKLLSDRLRFDPKLIIQEKCFLRSFHDSSYYFMWPFSDMKNQFDQALDNIQSFKRPYQDVIFDMLEELVSKI